MQQEEERPQDARITLENIEGSPRFPGIRVVLHVGEDAFTLARTILPYGRHEAAVDRVRARFARVAAELKIPIEDRL